MKFSISANPKFKREVALTTADGQSGKVEFEFKYVKPSEYQAFMDDARDKKIRDVLAGVITGWNGVAGANGNDMPYTTEALYALLDEHYIADVIFGEFIEGLRGARQKN